MRAAYGESLLAAGSNHSNIFVLDADCASSTKSNMFASKYPRRFANVGISEQSLVGTAAGMASVGWKVVVNAFAAMLVHRAHEQIMQSVGLTSVPVMLVGHYAGVSSGEEGAPHHSISDIALMRAVPGMNIWWPSDDDEVRRNVPKLIHTMNSPLYMRLERNVVPSIVGGEYLAGGALRYWAAPRPGNCVIASGGVVGSCVEAAQYYQNVSVLSVERLQPLPILEMNMALGDSANILIVEEHAPVGGLAASLWESQVLNGKSVMRACLPGYTQTGSQLALKQRYGLDVPGVRTRISSLLSA